VAKKTSAARSGGTGLDSTILFEAAAPVYPEMSREDLERVWSEVTKPTDGIVDAVVNFANALGERHRSQKAS
jgi:hypothetical protein